MNFLDHVLLLLTYKRDGAGHKEHTIAYMMGVGIRMTSNNLYMPMKKAIIKVKCLYLHLQNNPGSSRKKKKTE